MAVPVAGLDAGFLLTETPTMPWHVLGVLIVDPSTAPVRFDATAVGRLLEARLAEIEAFHKRVSGGPFDLWPHWSDDDVDLGEHLHVADLPSDATLGDLARFAAGLSQTPLDRSRPLWEIHVVESMADGRAAVVAKLHHALADGVSAVGILAALLDVEPQAPGPATVDLSPADPPTPPGLLEVPRLVARAGWGAARAGLRAVGRGASAGRHSFGFMSARTSGHARLTARRQVALGSMSTDDVALAKDAYGVTFNTIVLAAITGAVRRWLDVAGQLPDRSLLAAVPVSLRGVDDARLTSRNQVSVIFVSLPVHVADPVERVRFIDDDMARSKALHQAAGETTLGDLAAVAPWRSLNLVWQTAWRTGAARIAPPAANLVVSSVPGPPLPLYLAGAQVTGLHPLGPLVEGIPLNLTAVSYGDHVDVGVIACPDVLPDIDEVPGHLAEALSEIVASAPGAAS